MIRTFMGPVGSSPASETATFVSRYLFHSATWSGESASTGSGVVSTTAGASLPNASARGKKIISATDAASHATVSVVAVWLRVSPLMSSPRRAGMAVNEVAAAAATRKIPATLTYMAMHSGHAVRRTKNEVYP